MSAAYANIFAATTRVPNLAGASARRSRPAAALKGDSTYGAVIGAPAGTDPMLWSVLSAAERRQVLDGDNNNLMIFGLMKQLVAGVAA